MATDQDKTRAELMRLVPLIAREGQRIVETLAKQQGVPETDMQALSRIMLAEVEDRPLTAGKLGTELGLTSGAVTFLIKRLRIAGWIEQKNDAQDRRVRHVVFSEAGRDLAMTIYPPVLHLSEAVMDKFTRSELSVIERFMSETLTAMTFYCNTIENK